jgi:hypothetical protein
MLSQHTTEEGGVVRARVIDDHVESLAEQEVLGLAGTALHGYFATALAERVAEPTGILGQNQNPHTLRVTADGHVGSRVRVSADSSRTLIGGSVSSKPHRKLFTYYGRKCGFTEKEESDMRRRGTDRSGYSPEQLQVRLSLLAIERQRLRDAGSSRELLENNRLEIGRCQHELSSALIRRHLVRPTERAA